MDSNETDSNENDYMQQFTDDDFKFSAAQFDVDYLENIASDANSDSNDLSRKSLFVKFDPLVSRRSPRNKITPNHRVNMIPKSEGYVYFLVSVIGTLCSFSFKVISYCWVLHLLVREPQLKMLHLLLRYFNTRVGVLVQSAVGPVSADMGPMNFLSRKLTLIKSHGSNKVYIASMRNTTLVLQECSFLPLFLGVLVYVQSMFPFDV